MYFYQFHFYLGRCISIFLFFLFCFAFCFSLLGDLVFVGAGQYFGGIACDSCGDVSSENHTCSLLLSAIDQSVILVNSSCMRFFVRDGENLLFLEQSEP